MGRTSLCCAAAAALCAALIAGCGGGSSSGSGSPQEAARAYVEARNQGDAGKVCELYSAQLIQRLHAANCEAFVREQTSGIATSLSLVGVQRNGDRATATITSSVAGQGGRAGRLRITLERRGDEWKITGLGAGSGD